MSIVQIHASISTTVMLYNAVVSVWGFIKFLRKQDYIDSTFWGAAAISPILGLGQALLGIVMIGMGLGASMRLVHYLYGTLCVIAIPATFAFTRGRDDRAALLIYAAALMLTAIFGARAFTTAYGGAI